MNLFIWIIIYDFIYMKYNLWIYEFIYQKLWYEPWVNSQFSTERDAFDTLFDHAPDKLSLVKRLLIEFANRHLEKVNLTVTDLDTQVN